MTTGRLGRGLLEHEQSSIRQGRRTVYATTGRPEQQTPPPSRRGRSTFRGTTGQTDPQVDYAGWSTTPQAVNATSRELADASVRCLGS